MVRWELAVALAARLLEIDPFDQPNVQEAKDATSLCSSSTRRTGRSRSSSRARSSTCCAGSSAGARTSACRLFIAPTDEAARRCSALQGRLRDAFGVAVTSGFGPRYLHSTGQLHKGGPPIGAFIQLLDDVEEDVRIPGRSYSFRPCATPRPWATPRRSAAAGCPWRASGSPT